MSSSLHPKTDVPSSNGFIERGPDLPSHYGVTRLVILPRDPFWLHAYWEIAPYTWDEVNKAFGPVREQGKPVLRLRSSGGGSPFDVAVDLDARNWYIRLPGQGGAWVAEIGLVLPDGRFVLLATSNEIHMPNGAVSDVIDERWGVLREDWEKIFELSGGGRVGAGSMEIAKMLAARWEFLRSVSSWSGSWGGASSVSSWARPPRMLKDFWLIADCELIVYGATEPTARVKLQGQEIKLNPDGTFSFRFALPDGRLDIPIEAVNQDGDMSKSISFTVTRSTQKSD